MLVNIILYLILIVIMHLFFCSLLTEVKQMLVLWALVNMELVKEQMNIFVKFLS